MTENAALTTTTEQPTPPPFEPDPELIGHMEGNRFEERLYRRAAEKMRQEAQERPDLDLDG
jgi:hypothetical protein